MCGLRFVGPRRLEPLAPGSGGKVMGYPDSQRVKGIRVAHSLIFPSTPHSTCKHSPPCMSRPMRVHLVEYNLCVRGVPAQLWSVSHILQQIHYKGGRSHRQNAMLLPLACALLQSCAHHCALLTSTPLCAWDLRELRVATCFRFGPFRMSQGLLDRVGKGLIL